MRVIAGEFKGRTIKAVPGNRTRPTLDKVKESMFNVLGQYFEGGNVLDLYAGSGNLGLEALSRGCDYCTFVDKSYQSIKIIKENIESLQLDEYATVLKMDASQALNKFSDENKQFDYVFLDPPYKKQKVNEIITFLIDQKLLTDDAMVVCETPKEDELITEYKTIYKHKEYKYGITKLTIYKKDGVYHE